MRSRVGESTQSRSLERALGWVVFGDAHRPEPHFIAVRMDRIIDKRFTCLPKRGSASFRVRCLTFIDKQKGVRVATSLRVGQG